MWNSSVFVEPSTVISRFKETLNATAEALSINSQSLFANLNIHQKPWGTWQRSDKKMIFPNPAINPRTNLRHVLSLIIYRLVKYRCSTGRGFHISRVRSPRCFRHGNVRGDVLSAGNTSPIVHKASAASAAIVSGFHSQLGVLCLTDRDDARLAACLPFFQRRHVRLTHPNPIRQWEAPLMKRGYLVRERNAGSIPPFNEPSMPKIVPSLVAYVYVCITARADIAFTSLFMI